MNLQSFTQWSSPMRAAVAAISRSAATGVLTGVVLTNAVMTLPIAAGVFVSCGSAPAARILHWSHYWAYQAGGALGGLLTTGTFPQTYITPLQSILQSPPTHHPAADCLDEMSFSGFLARLPRKRRVEFLKCLAAFEASGVTDSSHVTVGLFKLIRIVWLHQRHIIGGHLTQLPECILFTATLVTRTLMWQRGHIFVYRDSSGSVVAIAACAMMGSTMVTGPFCSLRHDAQVYHRAMKSIIELAIECRATDINWQWSPPRHNASGDLIGAAFTKQKYALAVPVPVDWSLAQHLPS